MTMLHLLPRASGLALEASQLAGYSPSKTAMESALEHEAAAEAHREAALTDTPLRVMHEQHAATHARAAESLREIARRQ